MPTYNYKCNACDREFEKILRMTQNREPLSEPCGGCGETGNITQIITGGTGWHEAKPKPDSGFKDVMKGIKKASGSGCTIPDY
jgi:putative FmdB family regulatory protein